MNNKIDWVRVMYIATFGNLKHFVFYEMKKSDDAHIYKSGAFAEGNIPDDIEPGDMVTDLLDIEFNEGGWITNIKFKEKANANI